MAGVSSESLQEYDRPMVKTQIPGPRSKVPGTAFTINFSVFLTISKNRLDCKKQWNECFPQNCFLHHF